MDRREFLHAGAASLALSAAGAYAAESVKEKPKRAGLIGCG